MNTEILEDLNKEISSIFRTKENQEKYEKLIAERENLLQRQSSGERENLEREIAEIKNRQSTSGERRERLLKIIAEKSEIVRHIQPQLDKATAELNQANFDLSIFDANIQNDRITLKNSIAKLEKFSGVKNDDENGRR